MFCLLIPLPVCLSTQVQVSWPDVFTQTIRTTTQCSIIECCIGRWCVYTLMKILPPSYWSDSEALTSKAGLLLTVKATGNLLLWYCCAVVVLLRCWEHNKSHWVLMGPSNRAHGRWVWKTCVHHQKSLQSGFGKYVPSIKNLHIFLLSHSLILLRVHEVKGE